MTQPFRDQETNQQMKSQNRVPHAPPGAEKGWPRTVWSNLTVLRLGGGQGKREMAHENRTWPAKMTLEALSFLMWNVLGVMEKEAKQNRLSDSLF